MFQRAVRDFLFLTKIVLISGVRGTQYFSPGYQFSLTDLVVAVLMMYRTLVP